MSRPQTAVITVVHGRHQHLALQEAALAVAAPSPDLRCVVAIDDDAVTDLVVDGLVEECPSTDCGLPLARARNAGAERALQAGADLLIFLDVDCLPSAYLIGRYREAHCKFDDALLSGPVTYLPPASDGYRLDRLAQFTNPHPARPAPAPGVIVVESNYDLFWSLSFAVSSRTWRHIGGFCEDYVGYGGEDTDFAALARQVGIPFMWVGGADAYHQYHAVSDPPTEHLDSIVNNARLFRERWGRWPMEGWLREFEARGMLTRCGDEIAVTATL